MTESPKSLLAAVRYFSDPKVCFETMLSGNSGKVILDWEALAA